MRPFIVLGKARCGSTYLLSLLNSNPRILAFGELFRERDRIGWDIPAYDRDCQSGPLIEMMRSDPVTFVEENVFGRHREATEATGFKLFYYQAQDGPGRRLWKHLERRRGLSVIHLKRRNTLRELLSLKRAELTGQWSLDANDSPRSVPVELDAETCRLEFEYARDAKIGADAAFAGQPVLQVVYEDLVRDAAGETVRIQRFLGVSVQALAASTVRQSSEPLSVAISNYRDLERAFRGTAWEEFFDG